MKTTGQTRSNMPLLELFQHNIGDPGNQFRRDLDVIHPAQVARMSRVYSATIRSLNPFSRVWPLRAIFGSNVPLRSCGPPGPPGRHRSAPSFPWWHCGCCPIRSRPGHLSQLRCPVSSASTRDG